MRRGLTIAQRSHAARAAPMRRGLKCTSVCPRPDRTAARAAPMRRGLKSNAPVGTRLVRRRACGPDEKGTEIDIKALGLRTQTSRACGPDEKGTEMRSRSRYRAVTARRRACGPDEKGTEIQDW